MQLQGFMFMLFIMFLVPFMAIFSNHLVFFILMVLLITIISIKNIYFRFFETLGPGEEAEIEEEIEEMMDININRLSKGIAIARDIVFILFYLYCNFYLHSFLLKVVVSLLIVNQLYFLQKDIRQKDTEEYSEGRAEANLKAFTGLLSLILVVFTCYNMFFSAGF